MFSRKDGLEAEEEEEEDEENIEQISDKSQLLPQEEDEYVIYEQDVKSSEKAALMDNAAEPLAPKPLEVKYHCCRRFANGAKKTRLFALMR